MAYRDDIKKVAVERNKLSRHDYAEMKNVAKQFIPRIKKCFGLDIVAAIENKNAAARRANNTGLLY